MNANSIARKNRWTKIPKEKRSKIMSKLVSKRWANKTKEERAEYGRMMARKRLEKAKAIDPVL